MRFTKPNSSYSFTLGSCTTAPFSRQPHMPNEQPITSTRKPPRRFPRPARPDFDPVTFPLLAGCREHSAFFLFRRGAPPAVSVGRLP